MPISLNGFDQGYLKWGDLDNDGDLDIVSSAGIYRNDGNDVFKEITTSIGGGKLGDLDNDGDLDILSISACLKIYVNEGDFLFTEITIPNQTTKILIDRNSSQLKTNINSKTQFHSDKINSPMEFYGSAELGDYDSDGDLDILSVNSQGTKIYRNDGNLLFTEPSSIMLPSLLTGAGVFGDYDNDGDLDIFLTGGNTFNDLESGIYRNDGNDTFTQQPFYYDELEIISWASAHWGDYDNDGDLDLLVNGESPHSQGITRVFINNIVIPNNSPSPPTNLNSVINGYNVTLNWDKSFDKETLQEGLKYNLVVGSEPGIIDIVSSMSDASSGFRRIVNQGNTNHNNSWELKELPYGRYYWNIQAIDNNFAGSQFCTERTFAIPYSTHHSIIPAGNVAPTTFGTSLVSIQFTTANNEDLDITVDRFNNFPGGSPPGILENISDTYWILTVNSGNVNGIYNLILDLSQISGINDYSTIHLLKRENEDSPWIDMGITPDINADSSAVVWSGLTSFSQFGLGGGSENPLPVELSSFSALVEKSSINLSWRTETELNNLGFEVQRKSGEADWLVLGFVEGYGNSTIPRQYSFLDKDVIGGKHFKYRLKQIDQDGKFEYSDEIEVQLNPAEFTLHQNYPNPFNPTTKIRYQLPQQSKVVIKVYDILGAEVLELVNEKKESGLYEVNFNAQSLPSGTYYYIIK